ncbi:PTS transporter subunit EIIC [Vagococcus zengguangii]|uniref:PTS beta-glucoside transporter subunit EIIBCA n=1 Tax=Vagococcus zengguangii TaxID=2571750 RepID=A0A4D7CSG4_9ENTE|nr:PTS transporter subunit EIIC [Vagococcus zengguangii]QCI85612.1 PTS beta-glucoside transporter subunit EIIBCA [Vagococcus zengguangii]TLG79563.1 PTS beta-glucoside transporter subunit EIIBCA [Vagococcus zengguangii]
MSKNKVRDYSKLAKDIFDIVGGNDNIVNVTRCATRLRIVLQNTTPEMVDQVSQLAGVITVVENSGQFQVVIGSHVGEVFNEFSQLANVEENDVTVEKGSILNRIIATMSAVFAPFVYILAAGGILQGCLIIAKYFNESISTTGTFQVLELISWTPFTFLPILIAITASKHFKTNTYIAVACCAALINPTWAEMAARIAGGENLTFLGIALSKTTYGSTVLPPILLVWLLSYLEKALNKYLPEVTRALLIPFLSMVIMVPLTLLVVGPLSNGGAILIADGYNKLVEVAPAVAGMLIGGLWQVVVIFGIHWGVTPMCIANFEQYGQDSFQAFQTIAVVAQVGATLGVFFKTRDKSLKNISLSAAITGFFGITEPSIYGVTLRLKKPFIIGCISGAIGGLVVSFFNSVYYVYAGLPGLLTTVNGISKDNPSSFTGLMIGCAIALILPIVIMQLTGYEKKKTV